MNLNKAIVWADSIFKGVIYDEKEKKYRLSKKNGMNDSSSALGIELENNAHYGLTAPKAARLLHEKIKENKEFGSYAIIELGGNDSDYHWGEISDNPAGNHQPNTLLGDFKKAIKQMIDDLKGKNIKPILVNLPPIDPEKYFAWISKGLSKENILKWLGSINRIYTTHEIYSLAIMDIAYESSCKLINIREEFLKDDYKKYLCTDGIHLNENGQVYLNTILQNNFRSILSE